MSNQHSIRILCVDDHRIVREGLRPHHRTAAGHGVVGIGSSGDEAVELFTTVQPDVTLMDLNCAA